MSRPILSVNNIEVIYDHVILVLRGVSPARNRGRAEGPRSGLYLLPPPGGAPGLQGRLYLGRRAADAGDRTGPHGEAQADAARRAVDGPGPDARPGDLRDREPAEPRGDRKSTRLNSSHLVISYAVFCLKKKKRNKTTHIF